MIKKVLLFTLGVILVVLSSFSVLAVTATLVNSPYKYSFNTEGTLQESGKMDGSSSPYWWVNSGAYLFISNGLGKTNQGALSSDNKWRLLYNTNNPLDTDNGYHPQNIFRLLTRSKWLNSQETAYFKINKDQLSVSPNRDSHNGLLLMSRYQDGNNLYYTGIRVDGAAVIKKKINGRYYTLAYKKIFPGTYDRKSNPNLLPKSTWIGLRSEVKTLSNGRVNIKLYMDKGKTGNWNLILETTDSKSPLLNQGYGGIRTDFMDVEIEDYSEVNI